LYQSVIQVIDNPVAHSKMKHVELHVHYLQQLVHDDIVYLEYYCIEDQVIDIFTQTFS
jgi:hypothetical protein